MGGFRVRCRRRGHYAHPANPPRSDKPPAERSDISEQSSLKTLPHRGSLLPVPDDGHQLEIQDATDLLFRSLLPYRLSPPREIHYEEPAQRNPDCRCFDLLLVALLRHESPRPYRPTPSTDPETKGWVNVSLHLDFFLLCCRLIWISWWFPRFMRSLYFFLYSVCPSTWILILFFKKS